MNLNTQVQTRLNALLKKGEEVLATGEPHPPEVIGDFALIASDAMTFREWCKELPLDEGRYVEWRSQTLLCLTDCFGSTHRYTETFESGTGKGPYTSSAEVGIGILRAALEDIENASLSTLNESPDTGQQPSTFYNPSVFNLPEAHERQNNLVSVMMPLDANFGKTYEAIKTATSRLGLICKRADDIWKSQQIMQDIVELIATSRVVIVDCSGKNPNVFYEMGIAHTLGNTVIPITRNESDIPFDIQRLRYLHYLDNREGLDKLQDDLYKRLQQIINDIEP